MRDLSGIGRYETGWVKNEQKKKKKQKETGMIRKGHQVNVVKIRRNVRRNTNG